MMTTFKVTYAVVDGEEPGTYAGHVIASSPQEAKEKINNMWVRPHSSVVVLEVREDLQKYRVNARDNGHEFVEIVRARDESHAAWQVAMGGADVYHVSLA